LKGARYKGSPSKTLPRSSVTHSILILRANIRALKNKELRLEEMLKISEVMDFQY